MAIEVINIVISIIFLAPLITLIIAAYKIDEKNIPEIYL